MLWKCCGYIISHSKFQMQTTFVVVYSSSSKGIFCEVLWNFVGRPVVEDKFFTSHGFISLATRTTSILLWILGKSLLKPKRAHIHTKRRQSPWFKLMAHHLIFWLMIQAHESHRGNFGSHDLEGQEVCSVKLQLFKVNKGKHITWHVFPNSLNSDGSVCNR